MGNDYREGKGAFQGLSDSLGKTVDKMYADINNYICDSCNEGFMSDRPQCKNCGSYNTRKI